MVVVVVVVVLIVVVIVVVVLVIAEESCSKLSLVVRNCVTVYSNYLICLRFSQCDFYLFLNVFQFNISMFSFFGSKYILNFRFDCLSCRSHGSSHTSSKI